MAKRRDASIGSSAKGRSAQRERAARPLTNVKTHSAKTGMGYACCCLSEPSILQVTVMTTMRVEELAREGVAFSLWLSAVLLNMVSVLWLGFQGLQWLHDGRWTSQPPVLNWICGVCPDMCSFVDNPHSWYGAAKVVRVLSEVPSGLALALLGVA